MNGVEKECPKIGTLIVRLIIAKVINKIYINKNSQLSQQTKPLAHCVPYENI